MLSDNAVVKAKRAIVRMYTGKCNIYEYRKVYKEDCSAEFEPVLVLEDVPCFLSHGNSPTAGGGMMNRVEQSIKLFLDASVEIIPGSMIEVTQNFCTNKYAMSGQPMVYPTHQEIELKLFEGWA